MRKVSLRFLTPDMILAKPVYHIDQLMLKVGTGNLDRFIDSLERLGITHLYVTDKLSEDIVVEDAISQETRQHCKDVLFSTMRTLNGQGILETDALAESADEVMEEILRNPSVLVSMNEIGTADDSTFNHSINVAIYSIFMARQLDYPKARMKKLAMGLLLHDVGKTMLDQEILYKKGKFTQEEYEHVKSHTVLGYEALKQTDSLTELSRIVALSHHERLDGSGYPYGLKGDEIHEFARIASIVDIYDALISERCYHKKRSIYDAVKMMKDQAAGRLDPDLLALFIQCLAIYPNGTMVRLSDGTLGIVKCQNSHMPYRPVVRIVRDRLDKLTKPYDIDLSRDLYINIKEASYIEDDNGANLVSVRP